jgi:hypothetical protein
MVAIFRVKGATSPEKAMTSQELGLPPRFEEAMKRRLGATGIFVEVEGKYYLDESRLKQFGEMREQRRALRRSMLGLRIVRMVVGVSAIVLILGNIFLLRSLEVSYLVVTLVILWVIITVVQLFFLSRARSRLGPGPPQHAQ